MPGCLLTVQIADLTRKLKQTTGDVVQCDSDLAGLRASLVCVCVCVCVCMCGSFAPSHLYPVPVPYLTPLPGPAEYGAATGAGQCIGRAPARARRPGACSWPNVFEKVSLVTDYLRLCLG
jgi:hypothetical protein